MSDLATNSWKTCNKTEQTDSEAEGLKLGISRARRPLELARTRLIVAGCMFSVCPGVLPCAAAVARYSCEVGDPRCAVLCRRRP